MNKTTRLLLPLLLIFSVFLTLYGIDWGLPSAVRKSLLMPAGYDTQEFYNLMKQSREDIYALSKGSPVGRYYGAPGSGITPVLASMDMTGADTVIVEMTDKVLANFIRPYLLRSHSSDEQMTIASLGSMKPRACDFYPRIFCYGAVYIYTVGASFAAAKIFGLVSLVPDLAFYFAAPAEMAKLFITGRALNSVFLALTLYFVFLTARRLYSERAGLLAVFLIAINPAVLFEAHIMKPYMLGTLLSVICLYYSLELLEANAKPRHYILAGLFAGLTAGTMSFYGYIIIAPLAAHLLAGRRFDRNLIYLFAVPAAAFLITNPYWLLKYSDMRLEMESSRSVYAATVSLPLVIDFVFHKLPANISYGLALLFLAGSAHAFARKQKADYLLLSSCVIPLLIFTYLLQNQEFTHHLSRFFIPWLVVFSILAARSIELFYVKYSFKPLVLLMTAILLAPTFAHSYLVERNFKIDATPDSTRLRAAAWLKEALPEGSVIALAGLPEPFSVPPFDFTKYKLAPLKQQREPKALPPDYFIAKIFSSNEPENLAVDYELIKRFEPATGVLGFRLDLPPSVVNTEILVYQRKKNR